MKSAGLILAAGESRRMGAPKALLTFQGETFLDRLVRLFAERCSPVIVVLGAFPTLPVPAPARTVLNGAWQSGQTSSMQRGLREVPADADGVLFTLVDHPAVAPSTLDALLAATGQLRIPRFAGQRGHPVWFSRELIGELLAVPSGGAARDVLRARYSEAAFLDVDDPGIVADIDDRSAYEALLEAHS